MLYKNYVNNLQSNIVSNTAKKNTIKLQREPFIFWYKYFFRLCKHTYGRIAVN